ncbi:transcription factor bHLH49-like isoform X1 [Iris pallida]|uniref:Transcription factor bHLH49-like isoform X1 n=1 Tax=Iris pallida TaxID=29817 RepID=A0AAX6EFB9_IRIPA|nr:transcription factor bHLH49-like isoform X1 [Iris pallida]
MSGDPSDQHISADGAWQFCQPPSVSICQGFQVGSSSSCPPVEPFQSSTLWNPGFSEKPIGLHPMLDVGWNSPDPAAVARLGMFSGVNPGMLPPSLSDFVERSARFSNFSAGPFGTSGASASVVQIQNSEAVRGVSVSMDHGWRSECPMENHRDNVVSEEASPGFVNVSGDSSSKGVSTKKRKKTNQDMELDPSCPQFSAESPMENVEAKKKVENNSATQAAGKSTGKNAKGSSDLPKEDYIHLRARCGQATIAIVLQRE